MIWKILNIVSPFLAAGLASWLTYVYGFRKQKSEVFLLKRLDALKEVHDSVLLAKRYCDTHLAEIHGNENAPWPESLKGYLSGLSLLEQTANLYDANRMFLLSNEAERFSALIEQISMIASMERAIIDAPDLMHTTESGYQGGSSLAEACLQELYKDLRESYGI